MRALRERTTPASKGSRQGITQLLQQAVPRPCRSPCHSPPLPVRPVWQAMLDAGQPEAEAEGALLLEEVRRRDKVSQGRRIQGSPGSLRLVHWMGKAAHHQQGLPAMRKSLPLRGDQ